MVDFHIYGNTLFDRIKILFFGSAYDCVDIYQFQKHGNLRKTLYQETANEDAILIKRRLTKKIVGIEIDDIAGFHEKLTKLLQTILKEPVVTLYFVVKKRKHISIITSVINQHSLGKGELYGIDPCYLFSLVPLSGKGYQNIEYYILSLKSIYSIVENIKLMIKKLLVFLRLSSKLYEAFVVVVQVESAANLQPESTVSFKKVR